jgi:hypothetical protein
LADDGSQNTVPAFREEANIVGSVRATVNPTDRHLASFMPVIEQEGLAAGTVEFPKPIAR